RVRAARQLLGRPPARPAHPGRLATSAGLPLHRRGRLGLRTAALPRRARRGDAGMSAPSAADTEALREQLEASRQAPGQPYRGLEPFGFADTGILAAREAEIERLVRLVTMYRGVLLYGESGSGKSSLVSAGLLPRL